MDVRLERAAKKATGNLVDERFVDVKDRSHHFEPISKTSMRAETITNNAAKILVLVFCVGLFIAVADEGLRIYRAWTNKTGTAVPGYGLYERTISSKRLSEIMPQIYQFHPPKWEFLDFYRYKFMCDWTRSVKQRGWVEERERSLKVKTTVNEDSPNLYSADELPIVRYECGATKILYRAGMGWGLF